MTTPPNRVLRALLRLVACLALFAVTGAPSCGKQKTYGLDQTAPVGPFLDGVLPVRKPQGNLSWAVEEAFPAMAGLPPTATVIVPNPVDGRIYAASRDGQIVSFPNDPLATQATPFMDLRDRVAEVQDGGFLGLAFHPEFGVPGSPYELAFYAYFASYCPTTFAGDAIDFSKCTPGYPRGSQVGWFLCYLRLSRFTAYWDPVDGVYKGDPASESPLFNQRLYNESHRGGGMLFDPNGLLFLTIGDQNRYETAQEIVDTLEGGVIRIAVDVTDHGDGTWSCPAGSHLPRRTIRDVTGNGDEISGRLYCIPDDNPWLDPGGGVFEEYWTIGNRNPHRLAQDPVSGRMWSGEVGESTREEINVIEKGHNYGWPFREGLIAGPRPQPPSILGVLTDPVIDFTRADAHAVIGGYVYRGSQFPELVGRFIAGDWFTRNVWAIDLDPSTMTATATLLTTFDPGGLATFGETPDGELLLGSATPGVPLQRLTRVGVGVPDPPPFLSQLGAFDDLETLDVHDGAIPFEPLKFWSDGADKYRWMFLPSDGVRDSAGEQIAFSETGNWDFPIGTVLMKHFELPVDENDPSVTVRVETRFFVRGDDGVWFGFTYRWNAAQTDATLLTTAESGDYTIQEVGGGSHVQTWTFPSRSDCLQCHNVGVAGPAGPRTHQLNRDFTYPSTGRTDNQLRTWNHLNVFTTPLQESAISGYLSARPIDDAKVSLELRARSYLDTNCGYCHRPDSGNRALFDARLTTPLESQGLVWGGVIDGRGLPDPYVIKPGDVFNSLAHYRASVLGQDAMPPLAKGLVDQPGVDLLAAWITRIGNDFPRHGLAYEYFEEAGLTALPDFDALTPVKTGVAGTFDLSVRQRDDDFALRWTGFVEVPSAGDWTFTTISDAGSQLFVDGNLVVDNDGLHAPTAASGTIALGAGFHDVVVTYFEAQGPESMSVEWQGPGTPQQAIDPSRLYQVVPAPSANGPPTFTAPPTQQSAVNDVVSLAVSASDPDADPLYFTASGLPAGLAIDPDTGVIQGTLTAASLGNHLVTLGVSDGPEVAFKTFYWVVE